MGRLDGDRCSVTGAGRGIGAAIAQAFARKGAAVVGTDKAADLAAAVAAAVADDIGAQHMRLDVTSEADRAALAEVWPACDVLVNNAGITGFEEVALLLASDEAASMTGAELAVDGGLLAGIAAVPKMD